jgi:lipopolysaccharide transport system permease protein
VLESLRRLIRGRSLIWTLARRNLAARYRGSFLGYLWSLLNPLLLLVIYSVVFSVIFRQGADVRPYALFLFGGVLAWNFLAASLLEAVVTFRENGPLLRKVIVSPEIFPGVSVVAQVFHLALALPVLAAAMVIARLFFGGRLGWPALEYFPILALFALAVLGAALFLSAVSVHFKDLRDLLQNLLTFWFFASPVIYTVDGLPARLRAWIRWNPATPYFLAIHDSIFYARGVSWRLWLEMAVVAAGSLAVGAGVFARLRDSIAEEA